MPSLDIDQALRFLDMLDPGGRHTLASEAPFGGKDGGPLWERGQTHEADERAALIKDIQRRQARKSNVYYSVNRPCPDSDRQGSHGKNNIDDIIGIRALAFDIDRFQDAQLLNMRLTGALKPSIIINTGGGVHLIYLLNKAVNVDLYRPEINDEQKQINKLLVDARTDVSKLAYDFEGLLRSTFPTLKIDNMSNVDRVMRLPGTVNYPKAQKRANGQVEALAHIAVDNQHKCDLHQLRLHVPRLTPSQKRGGKFHAPKDSLWPPNRKAVVLCEFIRDKGLADDNGIYTHWVMLPLIGMIHDDDENNRITLEEAEECFLEAVAGGERYGMDGRGEGYFRRQWRSHHPALARRGSKSIGSLIKFCKDNGMVIPWYGAVNWEKDFERQQKELQNVSTKLSDSDIVDLRSYFHAER